MTLRGLIQAVETGNADFDWGFAASPSRKALPEHWHDAMNAYLGSLDAAKRLHDALLPGWFLTITRLCDEWDQDTERLIPSDWRAEVYDGTRTPWGEGEEFDDMINYFSADNADPARATLLAILRALEGEQDA